MGLRSTGNQNPLEVDIAPVRQSFFPSRFLEKSSNLLEKLLETSGGLDFLFAGNFFVSYPYHHIL